MLTFEYEQLIAVTILGDDQVLRHHSAAVQGALELAWDHIGDVPVYPIPYVRFHEEICREN